MRYLRLIAELSVQLLNLDHLHRLCVIEMISRTVKRILQKDMQQGSYSIIIIIISHYMFHCSTASLHNVVTVVVYFLNCYLVSTLSPLPSLLCHHIPCTVSLLPLYCVIITPCTVSIRMMTFMYSYHLYMTTWLGCA